MAAGRGAGASAGRRAGGGGGGDRWAAPPRARARSVTRRDPGPGAAGPRLPAAPAPGGSCREAVPGGEPASAAAAARAWSPGPRNPAARLLLPGQLVSGSSRILAFAEAGISLKTNACLPDNSAKLTYEIYWSLFLRIAASWSGSISVINQDCLHCRQDVSSLIFTLSKSRRKKKTKIVSASPQMLRHSSPSTPPVTCCPVSWMVLFILSGKPSTSWSRFIYFLVSIVLRELEIRFSKAALLGHTDTPTFASPGPGAASSPAAAHECTLNR
nr:uncharacterized protein LOC108384162 [Manis javanica]